MQLINQQYERQFELLSMYRTKYRRILIVLILFMSWVMLSGYYNIYHRYLAAIDEASKRDNLEILQKFDIITDNDNPVCEQLLREPPNITNIYDKPRLNSEFWANFSDHQVCEQFKKIALQPMWSSMEEQNYSLAFSIMFFEGRQQFARLLRMIYRPHNIYCVHIDAKVSFEIRQSIIEAAHCFGENVIIVPLSKSTDVRWGYYSVLEPSLTCAQMLLDYPNIRWNYLLNVNTKEFPILTNWELVRSIKALNGSNVAEYTNGAVFKSWVPNGNFSFKIHWSKGYFLAVLRRELIVYMLTNDKSLQILEVMQKEKRLVKHPDEFLFSTLVYNPQLGVPGACYEKHHPNDQDPRTAFVARYVRWTWDKGGCPSERSRSSVCVFGVRDLHILSKRKEMFGNKFMYDFQPLALDCMEYWITKKLIAERTRNTVDPSFDEKFYSELYCSKNHAP